MSQSLSARVDRLLAIQGANQEMPVRGTLSWLDSLVWGRMVPLIPTRVASSTPYPHPCPEVVREDPAFIPGTVGSAFTPSDSQELG